ncbi:MAG: crotonase/enoyl-CoA hydratase family protein [Syntrophales bacterium LBB04]|nr:crotonase/enoyl-CoA hydratase family protein [Syntrophales bacterium LBB04]
MSERVVYTIENGVADVRLNRPEKMNALDPAMFKALIATGKELAAKQSLRAVVLSGEGKAFSAGLDFMSFQALADSDRDSLPPDIFEPGPDSPANFAQQPAYVWHVLPVPVITAIHGVAYGGGLQVALGADIRLVAPDARLSVLEIKWGLVPDMGGTQLLRHLVRLDVLKELTYTGRVISGTEAVALGLATRVSENPFEESMKLAREIATKSPDAIRAGKKLLNASRLLSLEEGLRLEADLQRSIIGQPNQIEAVFANLEKRTPKFTDVQ